MLYGWHISWSLPTTPSPLELYPVLATEPSATSKHPRWLGLLDIGSATTDTLADEH